MYPQLEETNSIKPLVAFAISDFFVKFQPMVWEYLISRGLKREQQLAISLEMVTQLRKSVGTEQDRPFHFRHFVFEFIQQACWQPPRFSKAHFSQFVSTRTRLQNYQEQSKQFSMQWRQFLIDRSWKQMQSLENSTGYPFNTILQKRFQHPTASIASLSEGCTDLIRRLPSAQSFREFLTGAEEKFSRSIVADTNRTICFANPTATSRELLELDLLHFVQTKPNAVALLPTSLRRKELER